MGGLIFGWAYIQKFTVLNGKDQVPLSSLSQTCKFQDKRQLDKHELRIS